MFQVKMGLYTFIFGAFLEIIILQTAKADIPGCHFIETVNITSSQGLQNGSYMYQDLKIPVNLTGQYKYISTRRGPKQTVKSHLRGCVCHLKPCIWICCRFKDWDETNGQCTDGLMEELSGINPFLNVTLSNGSVVKRNLLRNFIVLRDRMRYRDFWKKDNYTLFENGSAQLNSFNMFFLKEYDCLHPNQFTSGNTESFVAAFHLNFIKIKNPNLLLPDESNLMWLSNVFFVLTIAVYLYVRKLRNLHGKCFICYMITSIMYFNHLLLENAQIPLQLCALHGYFMYYFSIAKFSWLLTMSHQLWKGFTSVKRDESAYSFGVYSIIAWGSPAIPTGVLFLVDQIWDSDPNMVKWVSGIGWHKCDFKDDWSYFGYITSIPMIIIVAVNTIFFILTIISIIRVKLSLRHFSDQADRARNLNSRIQTYKMFLRLVVIMDINWSVRVISNFTGGILLVKICVYCDDCIGVIIFVLFVLKSSTRKLIMER